MTNHTNTTGIKMTETKR